MAILAASTSEPTIVVRDIFEVVSAHRPAVDFIIRLQAFVNVWVLFLAQSLAWSITNASYYIFVAMKITVLKTAIVASFLACTVATQSSKALLRTWRSKKVVDLRKKIVFEFFVAILGPGNMLVIFVFWPGWLLIFGGIWLGKAWLAG